MKHPHRHVKPTRHRQRIDPTLQCVVDTGKPALLANKTVTAAPTYDSHLMCETIYNKMLSAYYSLLFFSRTSIVNPVVGVIRAKSCPKVCITLRPHTQRPVDIPKPP